jgi:23S rRNA-/tRNA-specific pseudouridylate synthase
MGKTDHDKKHAHHGKKRGMKPRSKRNRNRPSRGGIGILTGMHTSKDFSADDIPPSSVVQIDILPLKLPGDNRESNRRLRVIRPYPFTFATFAKERWLGRTVLDVYNTEFGSYPKCYYEAAIKEGRILVNGEKVDCEYIVKGNDELAHVVHRHEPAVEIAPVREDCPESPSIKVIHEDDELIVVDKPSTLPIHPCGGYNLNSLFHILLEQNQSLKGNLFNVHRLDRLTSGLTIIAKSSETAKVLGKCIMSREKCHKVYIARVKGKFPLNAPLSNALERATSAFLPSNGEWSRPGKGVNTCEAATCYWLTDWKGQVDDTGVLKDVFETKTDMTNLTETGQLPGALWLHLAVPVNVIDEKNGVCQAGSGKPAQTSFAVVGYDQETDSTIVLAKPETG